MPRSDAGVIVVAAAIGVAGRADPWGIPALDAVGRAVVSAGAAWVVLRLLRDDPSRLGVRIGRWMAAIGAAIVVAALDGFLALLVWGAVLLAVDALAGITVRRGIAAAGALVIVMAAAGGWALLQTADELDDVRRLTAGVEDELLIEPEEAQGRLIVARGRVDDARSTLDPWWARPARFVPVLSHHFELADAVLDASEAVIDAALPLAATDAGDLLQVGKLDLERIDELSADVADVAARAAAGIDDIDDIDRTWLVGPTRSELDDALDEFRDQADQLDRLARLSSGALPHLGADGPARWFVLVCTPAEARASCGFPGNWVEFVFNDGSAFLVDSGRTAALEDEAEAAGLTLAGPPSLVEHYGRFDPVPTLRNITITPDFPSSAEALTTTLVELGRPRPDVIAAVNTDGLEAILRVTGPVDSGPMGQLNVQSVRPRLDVEQYLRFETQGERREALEMATRAVVQAVTTLTDVDAGKVRRLSEPIERGGLLAYVPGDPDNVFVEMGVAGELPEEPIAGVTAQNAGANKLDAFRSVGMTLGPATAQTEGCAAVDISLGRAPPDAPDYVIGNEVGLPTGWIRSWVSVYTPTHVVSATLDGEPVDVEVRTEQGHPAVSLFVDTAPNSTSELRFVLERGATAPPVTLTQPSVQPYTVLVTEGCDPVSAGRRRRARPEATRSHRMRPPARARWASACRPRPGTGPAQDRSDRSGPRPGR